METLLYDNLTTDQREYIQTQVRVLLKYLNLAISQGVNGQTPWESEIINNLCISIDSTLRSVGYYDAMFPTDQFVIPEDSDTKPVLYIWEV